MQSIHAFIGSRLWGLALVAGVALLGATAAVAADSGSLSNAQSAYQKERAACLNGATNQDQATCLKEAGAALQASKQGGLDTGQARFAKRN